MLFLGEQLTVQILMLSQITLQSGNLDMSIIQSVFLGIQLGVKISILFFPINQKVLLVIDFLSQGSNHIDISFNSAFVIILHSSLFIGDSVEILFEIEELILQIFVFTFSLSEIHGLLTELGNKSILVVLGSSSIV